MQCLTEGQAHCVSPVTTKADFKKSFVVCGVMTFKVKKNTCMLIRSENIF